MTTRVRKNEVISSRKMLCLCFGQTKDYQIHKNIFIHAAQHQGIVFLKQKLSNTTKFESISIAAMMQKTKDNQLNKNNYDH